MKRLLFFLMLWTSSFLPQHLFAWGRTGHSIVAEIAFHYLNDSTKHIIESYLGSMSIEEAANWMDDNRSNSDYDYMKPLHFINIEKGEQYQPCSDNNIISELHKVMGELSHLPTIPHDEIRLDLLILFHLIGDLHQPLHVGYGIDKGGNSVKVSFVGDQSNLHKVWDTGIIDFEHISTASCIEAYGHSYNDTAIQNIDVVAWLNQTRSLLDSVYAFNDDTIDIKYCQKNKAVIEKQLFLAGIRLAGILETCFKRVPVQTMPKVSYPIVPGTITAEDAIHHIGETVTVCGKVYGGKYFEQSSGQPTFINVGAPYPNSPFTVVIFGTNRSAFSYTPEEFLNNKEICVTGMVKEFKGKAEIIASKESQIQVK
jgi:hypothetical protein